MKENRKTIGKRQRGSKRFIGYLALILVIFGIFQTASLNILQIKYATLQRNYTNLTQMQDLRVNTTLLSQYININPARNMSYCTAYGCSNYTSAGNYSLHFSINSIGYIKISTDSSQNLSIAEWETYNTAYGIPQNQMLTPSLPYLSVYPTTVTFSVLNKTTSPIALPVIPGNLTLKLYNYGATNYYGKISITYIR
jgi:hypothetical protein